ncbi:uncharacterized protein [Montipora foliosa]|uniref:uncharacterized protein n=1 Tax=Montipora foliosa TaxID=591990 RepID=UPI0035F12416
MRFHPVLITGDLQQAFLQPDVDDLISGKPTVREARELKEGAISIFADAKFKLNKWHSNVAELEEPEGQVEDGSTFAKQQLGSPRAKNGSLLGLIWDKEEDQIGIVIPRDDEIASKRGLLRNLARIYDPLGLVAPLTVQGKFIYRDTCNAKVAWDAPLPQQLASQWTRWNTGLPAEVMVARALTFAQEQIEEIELHAFGDASKNGVCATVHAVVRQPSGVNQGLVAAKARLAKQGLTIPRLELVSAHMAANLITNVRNALMGFPLETELWMAGQLSGSPLATDCLDDLLEKFSLTKTLRVVAWIAGFAENVRLKRKERMTGPLTTNEVQRQNVFWTKRAQRSLDDKVTEDKQRLGLEENDEDIFECRGRIQGHYPVHLPDTYPYTVKLVEDAHRRTLHGGVGLTMTRIRERYWVPRLRRLAKRVIKGCYGCRRFQVKATERPPPGNLPLDRTEGSRPFQVVGVDFAGLRRKKGRHT